MADTEQQAMTAERLAEIRMMVIEAGFTAANTPDPEWAYNLHSLGTELLAEVERLRAERAALVEKCAVLSDVLSLAQLPDDHIGEVIGTRRSRRILCACTVCVHARATLATVGEAGEASEQAAQGEA